MSLKESIRSKAKEIGFDLVGFTRAEPDLQAGTRLRQWLSQGYHAGMKYMMRAPERRYQPALLLPNAKTVISLGINYYKKMAAPDNAGNVGKIALYAWGKDYHNIINPKLAQLGQQLMQISSKPMHLRYYVDTGPLLERAFAQRAGLGFIGKNTTLITQPFGSWIFLAQIMTDLELEADEPKQSQCGQCDLCLKACPTGALVMPYVLNAKKCLSYHTVENRGVIPQGLRPLINGWLLGCDECQLVCPFNQHRPETKVNDFAGVVTTNGYLELESLFNLRSNQDFKAKFAQTALWRPGFLTVLRNAIIVAANHKQSHLPAKIAHILNNAYFKPLEEIVGWALAEIKRA